ncbi:T9SS type A sorting domain-containing protein [Flavobacterium sp.]|uniref:T9SS type A sorting domain-containing protein n=1 Tax=Flavobacterium sp. TaxID=239 RepID=UPI002618650C|nr:T9SS type A sorting domain-containing protein [Flavobacterium sp.]
MKIITKTIIICSLILGIKANAQMSLNTVLSCNFTYQPVSSNETNFLFQTNFSFGSGNCDNTFTSSEITIDGDTMHVKGFYDITGVWQAFFCSASNTVVYNAPIPETVRYIKMSTNVITYNDNPPYNLITVPDVYYRIIDLNNLSTNEVLTDVKISLAPNPTAEVFHISGSINFEKAFITNTLGQIVAGLNKSPDNNYSIGQLQNGLYYIEFYDHNNQKTGSSKIIKK